MALLTEDGSRLTTEDGFLLIAGPVPLETPVGQTIYFRRGRPIVKPDVDSTSHFDHARRFRLGQQVYSAAPPVPVGPPPNRAVVVSRLFDPAFVMIRRPTHWRFQA